MYNEHLKERFLETVGKSEHTVRFTKSIFDRAEPYETSLGLDICQMGIEDLNNVFQEISGTKVSSREQVMFTVANYCKWCIEQGVEGAHNLTKQLDIGSLEPIKKSMVASPMHLSMVLDNMFGTAASKSTLLPMRGAIWLMFFGMFKEQVVRTKVSDVDLENWIIHLDGEEFPICREALQDIKVLATEDQLIYAHPLYREKAIVRQRIDGDQLMRGVRHELTVDRIKTQLSSTKRNMRKAGLKFVDITPDSVRLSGRFCRMAERERIGLKPDFAPIVVHEMNYMNGPREFRDKKQKTQFKKYVASRVFDMRRDYQRWKQAFQI